MFYLFNILIIGFVLLIAYWWANQGVFSALLHLLAVIVAGAVALAVWEPLTMRLLRGTAFDDYAWGVTLLVTFIVVLLVVRVVMDKIVRANVDLPHWANLAFGLPIGAASGILTMGIFLIGAGHIQSHRDLLGVVGNVRSAQTGRLTEVYGLWFPVHELTYEFYGMLSVGSLRSGQPLRHYTPDLDDQAMALLRDSYDKGRGKLSLRPDDARVTALLQCQDDPQRFVVNVSFRQGAKDFGEQLTLSSAQVRLISVGRGSSPAETVHPNYWAQLTSSGLGRFQFDNASHYITSVPGREEAEVALEFATGDPGFQPKFIQIRGTRFVLPTPQQIVCGQGAALAGMQPVVPPPEVGSTGQSIQQAVSLSDSVRPIYASTNLLPAGVTAENKKLVEGEGTFPLTGAARVSRGLLIEGFYAPKGTSVVQLEVRRNGPVDLFGPMAKDVPPGAPLHLVDTLGNTYSPVGYMHLKPDEVSVKLVPRELIRSVAELPILPSSGTQSIKLIYNVTDGVTIAGFRWGDVNVGTCRLVVTPD